MNKEVREAIKKRKQDFREESQKFFEKHGGKMLHFLTLSDLEEEEKLQQQMIFDEPEDVDFELMDFFFDGMLSLILKHAGVCAHDYRNWGRAYEEFKAYISHYVGWYSFTSKEKHPMLHSREAYSLMMDMLSEACYKGADKRRRGKNNVKRTESAHTSLADRI